MGGKAIISLAPVALACSLLVGCSCGRTELEGETDASDDEVMADGSDTLGDPDSDGHADSPIDPTSDPHPDRTIPEAFPDPPGDCEPHGGVVVDFEIDGTSTPDSVSIDRMCTVESVVVDDAEHQIITLICDSPDGIPDMHEIDLYIHPYYADICVHIGDRLGFRYVAESSWWTNRWFALGTRLYGVDADALAPPGMELDEWYRRLPLWVIDGICTPGSTVCGEQERLAIGAYYNYSYDVIFDGNWWAWGTPETPINIMVEEATNYTDIECDDMPDTVFSAVIYLSGWC